MRHRLLVPIAMTVAFLLAPCMPHPSVAGPALTPAAERAKAPDISLSDSSGKRVTLSDFKGRVVLLDVWATWCTGCKVEIPWYITFQKKYARRGLSSIGVAMDEKGWETVGPYLHEHPIAYPIVVGDATFAGTYNVTSLPMTLLIDRHGRVADVHFGMVVKDEWEQEIATLLRER